MADRVCKGAVEIRIRPEMRSAIHGAFDLEANADGAAKRIHGVRAFGKKIFRYVF